MEVAVPVVVKAPNKISVSPKLDTIFEEAEEDEDYDFDDWFNNISR